MYNKGDLIHYKEKKFEGLLKVIVNDFGGNDNKYTIIFFACNDKHWAIKWRTGIYNRNREMDQSQGPGLGPVHPLAHTHKRVLGPVK
jgi:hypothetical protein